jgi:hypothetical protein
MEVRILSPARSITNPGAEEIGMPGFQIDASAVVAGHRQS